LQLTVRNTKPETRELLLNGIRRIAENMGRVAGLPEDLLPEVIVEEGTTPPMLNDTALASRINAMWAERMGAGVVQQLAPTGMGGEDYPYFSMDPTIPSAFWRVGGTSPEVLEAAENGGEPVPSHHSPLFKIEPEPSVRMGVESTVRAMLELMPAR
jgi:hippurate hydrolase